MAKFEFVQKDGSSLDYATKSVVCEKTIVAKVKVPLWTGVGQRISLAELKEAGLKLRYIPDQTKDRLEYEKVSALYAADSTFITRVTELLSFYNEIGASYDAPTQDIEAKLVEKFGDDKESITEWYARFNTALLNVKINYQAASRALYDAGAINGDAVEVIVDDFIVYRDFPALVKWLPGNYDNSEIPARREAEIIETSSREAEVIAEMDADAVEGRV